MTQQTLINLLSGAMATQVVNVATQLEIADLIADRVSHVDELGAACGIPPARLVRLLRAMAGLGLCTEPEPGRFALTDTGSLLRKDDPGSLREYARLVANPMTHRSWAHLETSIRTGRPGFEEAFGMPVFSYLARDPELSAMFNAAMSQGTRETATLLPDHYDFGRFTTVADIGGGNGALLTAILARCPQLAGIVFDTEEGVAQAADTARDAGVADRCTIIAGSFFDAVPPGADLYLIKSVPHNWDDDNAARILRRCREAVPADGRLLIIDPLLPDTAAHTETAENPYLLDLHMLVVIGGRQRTRTEFERLCARAGFTVTEVRPLPAHLRVSVIEAKPV